MIEYTMLLETKAYTWGRIGFDGDVLGSNCSGW